MIDAIEWGVRPTSHRAPSCCSPSSRPVPSSMMLLVRPSKRPPELTSTRSPALAGCRRLVSNGIPSTNARPLEQPCPTPELLDLGLTPRSRSVAHRRRDTTQRCRPISRRQSGPRLRRIGRSRRRADPTRATTTRRARSPSRPCRRRSTADLASSPELCRSEVAERPASDKGSGASARWSQVRDQSVTRSGSCD